MPCNGKHPTVTGWVERRLSAAEILDKLQGTDLNIAIALHHSDVIDVECDTPEAETALRALFGGEIPPTPTWRSKRGLHRLFRQPPGLPERAKLEIDGIEFRIGNNKGALSIVPPSVHPNGPRYEWLPGLSIYEVAPAELPAEIVARLQAPPAPAVEASTDGTIAEGKRNDTLFAKARALRDLLPPETILKTLLDLNQRLCQPPLSESEVEGIVRSAMNGEAKGGDFISRLLAEVELWHDENDEPFVTIQQDGHRENLRISSKSRPFRRWLCKQFYEATREVLGDSGVSAYAALLEGKAVYSGPRLRVWRRVAEHDGRFYLDLCDDAWRAVDIDADGWRIVDEPPVKFRRAKAMHPLTVPVKLKGPKGRAGALKRLLMPFLNLRDEQWPLVAAWLVAALRPVGPYPVLKMQGEQGSAKTTTARVLRSLIDPNAAPVRAEPRDTRDLMIAANNAWVICLDNLSYVKPDLSDALCRLATGGGFGTRTLYTDEDETIFDAMRPVILTSIEDIGTRSDLLERSLLIDLPTIAEGKRRAEKRFWRDFEKARPEILGALLDAVCGAIRRLPEIERKPNADLSRMADFEQWGEAAEEALGLEPGVFAEAYAASRESANQTALESSPLVAALIRRLDAEPVMEYTATELLESLSAVYTEDKRVAGWPKTPRVLSQILKRAAPNLRQIGIVVVQDTRGGGNNKEKVWRIRREGSQSGSQEGSQQPPTTEAEFHEAMEAGRRAAGVAK